jgi:phosphoribosylamine-glycine ligase
LRKSKELEIIIRKLQNENHELKGLINQYMITVDELNKTNIILNHNLQLKDPETGSFYIAPEQ